MLIGHTINYTRTATYALSNMHMDIMHTDTACLHEVDLCNYIYIITVTAVHLSSSWVYFLRLQVDLVYVSLY